MPRQGATLDPGRRILGQNAYFTEILFDLGLPVAKHLHSPLAIDPGIDGNLEYGYWVTAHRYGVVGQTVRPRQPGARVPEDFAVRRAFKDGENVGRAKNGKFQPAQIAATVQSEAPGTSAEPKKKNFSDRSHDVYENKG